MAVYCALHFAMALTVASASFTQLVWQSVAGQAFVICVCEAHIAVQACCRVRPVFELLDVFPPEATPPEPARVPPAADPVTPPEAIPPADDVPPPPDVPPRVAAPSLELASLGSARLLLLEQADMNIIAAGSTRKIEPVLCIGKLLAMQGQLPGKLG
jgi:hypothetical protein